MATAQRGLAGVDQKKKKHKEDDDENI